MPIRFDDIHPTDRGKADAFEELTCQLARRRQPSKAVDFRRIHGAGGDGGIEAYWVLEDGSEVGYQAKYYLRSSDVNWNAIDQSVQTALKLRPKLSAFVIALACDLTDKTARKGKTGWEKWDEHKSAWEARARSALGHEVVFELWTAGELRDMLGLPPMAGMMARWFGELAIEPDWLAERIKGAVANLDERYHAEDHVPVNIERVFDMVVRSDKATERFRHPLVRIKDLSHRYLEQATGDFADLARANVARVLAVASELDAPPWVPWKASSWVQLAKLAQGSLSVLATSIRDETRRGANPPNTARAVREGLAQLVNQIAGLERIWSSGIMIAERERAILLSGRGGSGKSHLLAGQAQRALDEGRPVVLVLGQHLRASAIWPQILSQLGVDGTPEKFLQALDSAAEMTGKRALFLVDALNEGAGASLWRNQIASFLETFRPYPNIACALSCRSEYLPYVLPKTVADKLSQFEVRGFESPEEQQAAARVYMDRKGIARPNSPWLAEEFRNPLFLRSVCVALQREGKQEFPRGLVGIKRILAFYIGSVARHLAPAYDGTDALVTSTRTALTLIARAMAVNRRDYLSRDDADGIARATFASFVQPDNQTWLEAIHRSGLVRFDPDPELVAEFDDPLPESIDVVRFSFQRFQDQLMAEALLAESQEIDEAFAADGSLQFLADRQQWTMVGPGLIGALAIQIPERYGRELIDVMPGGFNCWKDSPGMKPIFVDSLRLRATTAFSERTTELFEQWIAQEGWAASLLIELATITDHPWNAEAMHARLDVTPMPERDLRWTLALNEIEREDDSHGLNVLCRWCASPEAKSVVARTRELAALALAWCLTSTNRPVRDMATKALSHLMLAQTNLLPYLVDKLNNVDDNYVLERLWAAAFGACTHSPTIERLQLYSETAIQSVFTSTPRKSLLLRDHARAIIEMASHGGIVFEDRELSLCNPPYAESYINLTDTPNLSVTAARTSLSIEAQRIISSCLDYGDFGAYEIKPSLHDITNVALKNLPIATKESAFRHFKLTVLADRTDRIAAFYELHEHLRAMRMPQLVTRAGGIIFERATPSKHETDRAEVLLQHFIDLLSPEEFQCFSENASPWLADSYSEPTERVDVKQCQAWVAMRAIELGGAAIKVEGHSASISERPIIERLGKKYQWLALSELLCGLTSEFCLESGSQEDRTLQPYAFPTDLGLIRDIDPTVLSPTPQSPTHAQDNWMFGKNITLQEVTEEELSAWPRQAAPCAEFNNNVVRVDADGCRWIVLYDHTHRTDRYLKKQGEHGMRQQEFRRIFSVFVENSHLAEFVATIQESKNINVSHWEVPNLTDGPYLGEIPWRETVPQAQWSDRGARLPATTRLASPICLYKWESHLDLSLTDGARSYLPAPWLASKLDLLVLPNADDTILNSNGEAILMRKSTNEDDVVLLRETALERLRCEAELSCVWILVAERNAWPGGSNAAATWRRAEGLAWIEDSYVTTKTWNRDGSAREVHSGSRTSPRKKEGK
ncbi:hypothetical protein [Duganella sp. HH101]|uniref:hypothetical protein n=1 Tax=Duganella sp. HH101 TaxID=1781066 RepID=UPI000874C986|nr:hypothetical protein [Duganella sp. HH101]OFA05652.1 hypothetical protein DUGA2_12310 [Duganella sp. HH101]